MVAMASISRISVRSMQYFLFFSFSYISFYAYVLVYSIGTMYPRIYAYVVIQGKSLLFENSGLRYNTESQNVKYVKGIKR